MQRQSSSVNDHANLLNIGTAKGTIDHNLKVNDQMFNSHIDRSVFDSLHSYSKFSSYDAYTFIFIISFSFIIFMILYYRIGGTHTIKKNKRSKNDTGSFKKPAKNRTKPGSSKKSTKPRLPSGQFTDKVIMQNYRSANFTSKPTKMSLNADNASQKRYQYHKRIRSDTGNTLMNPLEKAYDREGVLKRKKIQHPSFVKAKTDISTPMVYSEDQRSSMIEKKLPTNTMATNSITINKYDFVPSFKQHKNMNFDANVDYLKFKSNKNLKNAHKLHSVKIKKIFKYKIAHKDNKSSDSRPTGENNLEEDVENDDQLIDNLNDYNYELDNLPQIDEVQRSNMHQLQLEGDHSLTLSKETDEGVTKIHPRPLTLTPGKYNEKLIVKNSIGNHRDSLDENQMEDYSEYDRRKDISVPVDSPGPEMDSNDDELMPEPCKKVPPSRENIKQIDCQSLNPTEMTKSKEDLISYIKNAIRE